MGLSIEVGCFVEKREIAGQAGNDDNDMDVIPKPSVAVDSTAETEFFSGGRVAECDAEGMKVQTSWSFGCMRAVRTVCVSCFRHKRQIVMD